MNSVKKISLVFSAGCLGGFLNSIVVWLFGRVGISEALGVSITPAMTPPWLYPRIVWGGLWGILFLLPILKGHPWWKGFVLSLGPTFIQLFIIFPIKAQKGLMGMDLGTMTPLIVVFFNAVWGITAIYWLILANENGQN